jgi:hypothetical protein
MEIGIIFVYIYDQIIIFSQINLHIVRWLACILETLGNLVILFTALFVVFQKDKLSSGLVGLVIGYSLSVSKFKI